MTSTRLAALRYFAAIMGVMALIIVPFAAARASADPVPEIPPEAVLEACGTSNPEATAAFVDAVSAASLLNPQEDRVTLSASTECLHVAPGADLPLTFSSHVAASSSPRPHSWVTLGYDVRLNPVALKMLYGGDGRLTSGSLTLQSDATHSVDTYQPATTGGASDIGVVANGEDHLYGSLAVVDAGQSTSVSIHFDTPGIYQVTMSAEQWRATFGWLPGSDTVSLTVVVGAIAAVSTPEPSTSEPSTSTPDPTTPEPSTSTPNPTVTPTTTAPEPPSPAPTATETPEPPQPPAPTTPAPTSSETPDPSPTPLVPTPEPTVEPTVPRSLEPIETPAPTPSTQPSVTPEPTTTTPAPPTPTPTEEPPTTPTSVPPTPAPTDTAPPATRTPAPTRSAAPAKPGHTAAPAPSPVATPSPAPTRTSLAAPSPTPSSTPPVPPARPHLVAAESNPTPTWPSPLVALPPAQPLWPAPSPRASAPPSPESTRIAPATPRVPSITTFPDVPANSASALSDSRRWVSTTSKVILAAGIVAAIGIGGAGLFLVRRP